MSVRIEIISIAVSGRFLSLSSTMRFDSLSLVGFKSFADKVQVSFDERITAIVGPNGCGKSNLFDALSWVLGAQNAREMRGAKMEDFIFGGSGKRKQSGMAQASLSVSLNETHSFDIQGKTLRDDRLEICRKLYRSGESAYLVNGRRCRLKDIHKILEGLGLDYASYALIAQGKIDAFMTAKPLERRAVIEEAARITGYKARRRRAELKLEMAQQNLLRINDIVVEVERLLRSLKRQAGKARTYKKLKEEFRSLQKIRFVLQAEGLQEELRAARLQLGQSTHECDRLEKELQTALSERKQRTELRNRLEGELSSLNEQSSKLLLEIDRTTNSIASHREQIEATHSYLAKLETDLGSIQQTLRQVQSDRARFEEESGGISREADRNEGLIGQHGILLEQSATRVSEVETAIERERNRILELAAQKASLTRLLEQLDRQLTELHEREGRLAEDHARSVLDARHWKKQVKESKEEVSKLTSKRSALEQNLHKQEAREAGLRAKVRDLEKGRTELNNQLIAMAERLQSLHEIDLSRSHYSDGVQKLLNSFRENGAIATSGTLADQIETHPEYEQLFESFLNQKLEYVLVDSMKEARLGLDRVLEMKGGRCSFLTLHSDNGFGKETAFRELPSAGSEGVVGTLAELMKMDHDIESAFQRVLPETANTVVVSNLEKAFHLSHSYPDSTFLTLDGATLTPRGLLTANVSDTQKLGLLTLKRKTKDLEARIGAARRKQNRLEKRLVSRTQEHDILQARRRKNQEELQRIDRKLWQCQVKLEQMESNLKREDKGAADLGGELQRVQRNTESTRQQQSQSLEQLTAANTEKTAADKLLSAGTAQLRELREELERVQQEYNAVASNHKVIQERKQALEGTLRRIGEQEEGLEARQQSVSETKQQSRQRVEEMTADIERMSASLSQFQKQEADVAGKLSAQRSRYQQWKSEAPRFENDLDQLRSQKETAQQSRSDRQVKAARMETQLQGIEDQCREQLEVSIEQLLSAAKLEGVDETQTLERYAHLKDRLEKFGPINMTALDEYQENEERHGFLVKQRADLEESISDTRQAIQDLNRRSREQFKTAFEAVNRNFKEVFQTLFGGGDCGMRLLDESDLLESGLEVYAQPPGKRLQNVLLLSGGEKALTVLALLVGLFAYRPSQFCVLDEVDAPLDDANVTRLTKLLRKMSEETQIIVVTHNKQTMEIADTLFGVTMQEAGVSQVVSVRM